MNTDDTADKARLRAMAEARLSGQEVADTLSAEEALHELRVHQIELEMQNESLRQTQLTLEEVRDRYINLHEFAPTGYLTLNQDGIIDSANLTAVSLLGRERNKLVKRRFGALIMPESMDRWTRYFMRLKQNIYQDAIEIALQRDEGTVFYAQLEGRNNQSQLHISLTDLTARRLMEEELRIAAVAFSAQNGMLITDDRGVIIRVNAAFTQLTGYSATEVIGKTPALLHSDRQGPLFYQRMWSVLKEKGHWQGEIWNRRKNGQIYAEMLTITAIYSPEQVISHYVGSFTDITENKEAEAEIHRLAYYDPLTNLPNRRLLQDRLHQAISAAARSGLQGALFFIDLDHFKQLNDSRGHDVGDLLLVDVAQRLHEVIRGKDTVARQSGDEFVVLMEELGATASEAAVLAGQLGDKLRAALAAPFNLNGYEYHCRTSIGVGLFHAHNSAEELFKHADLALYQAKNAGRDRLQFFDPAMQETLNQRSLLETALRRAIGLGQLQLHYQPQVNITLQVVGVEALLRWQHPQRGLVPPDEFIPLAEESGLILPIGNWVLETACSQIKAWENQAATRDLQVAVNVSVRQFRQPDFVAQLQRILTASGINPARLKLELTESLVLDNIALTIEKMLLIKKLGLLFSMDDFGTGYSSLAYLTQLPLDQLKIDKAFVRNLPGNSKDGTIARAIITMGLGLNMNVIAEGVETEAQLVFLETNGCQQYQGYLFSRPLSLDALESYLQQAG